MKMPTDFPLKGLAQLLQLTCISAEDRADEICLQLKRAITLAAEQAEFFDINDASLESDDATLISIRYLNEQNNWVSYSFRPDELHQLAATGRSNASDHRPTHG